MLKKILFASTMGAVMLFSGMTTTDINAKEDETIVSIKPKEDEPIATVSYSNKDKTKKFEQKINKMCNAIADYVEEKEDVVITSVEIDSINRKGTKADFTAEAEEGTLIHGTIDTNAKSLFGKKRTSISIYGRTN